MKPLDEIGNTAGSVWSFLNAHGPATLYALEKEVGAPKALVAMAIGWLAREGKLSVETEGHIVRYTLAR